MNDTAPVVALLDASVLYPALLRDVLMRLALHGLFQARWSPLIQDEWCEALQRNRPDLRSDQIARTRLLMDMHMPDASVTGFEHLVADIGLPDPGDRHVLAAAIHCSANVIVTSNLRHFPTATLTTFGLAAVHPDAFIAKMVRTNARAARGAMQRLLAALRNPAMTGAELSSALKRHGLHESAEALSTLVDL